MLRRFLVLKGLVVEAKDSLALYASLFFGVRQGHGSSLEIGTWKGSADVLSVLHLVLFYV